MSSGAIPKRILFATSNSGKLREATRILAPLGVEVVSAQEVHPAWESPEETGSSFEANACLKRESLRSQARGEVLMAEDAGLEVDALGGRPGIHSARYGETSAERNLKLLQELEDVPLGERGARFRCVLAVSHPELGEASFPGVLEGSIALEPLGEEGFGYDPVFLPLGSSRSLAEIGPAGKDPISHRKKALQGLVLWLQGGV